MGRPRKFSREELQRAALALVDAHGVEGLTMRALAARLGTGPMTIYNHVRDRGELEVLVIETVLGRTAWVRRRRSWQADVREIATAMWRAVRAHPRAIPLILVRRARSLAALEVVEALLEALARGGRSGLRLLVAFRAVSALVMGFAQAELSGPLARGAGESARTTIRRVRALPPERFPRLIEIAGAAVTSDPEREFRRGLDLLLAGLD
ncbi:MAG TPA: TetR/AcrR family transcriptional regulator C-terminal domain-containing protein [Candidatus Binatia bacterium]|jgi:AcrR family transcriptional regulator